MQPGDVVGIGIHTGNALRGYEIGTLVRARGATVVYGGIHATLFPDEARDLGGAHAIVKGDGDVVWPRVLHDVANGTLQPLYEGGRVDADSFVPGALGPAARRAVHVGLGADGPRLPQALLLLLGVAHRRPEAAAAHGRCRHRRDCRASPPRLPVRGACRRQLLSGDAHRPGDGAAAEQPRRASPSSKRLRAQRFELMARLAQLPARHDLLHADHDGGGRRPGVPRRRCGEPHIKGALVGVESVTKEGLKDVYKGFNEAGDDLVTRLRTFRAAGVHVLGSFIFGLPSDRPATFKTTEAVAHQAQLTFAQFVMLTPYPGTVDFEAWEKKLGADAPKVGDIPITRHWLIPQDAASEGLRAAPGDVARRNPRAIRRKCGTASTACATSGNVRSARPRSRRGSRSCSSRSSIARCMRTPASPPTARA